MPPNTGNQQPSRNPAPVTGKQRASRIPLDYYKKSDGVARWKLRLAGILAIVAVVWMATVLIAGKRGPLGHNRFSHGPISDKHAVFEHDCAACHVDFAILKGRDKDGTFAGDKKCQECHLQGDMAVHHQSQKADMTPNCGNCHADHRGTDVNLNQVADRSCVVCHRDLGASTTASKVSYKNVDNFASEHPPFRGLPADKQGKLKFNHKYHMTEGIVLADGASDAAKFKLSDIKDLEARARYRRLQTNTADNAPIKLACTTCHQPDSDSVRVTSTKRDFDSDRSGWEEDTRQFFERKQKSREPRLENGELRPPRAPGAYMRAITFKNDCAACHTLNFDKDLNAPHGDQPAVLKVKIEDLLAAGDRPDTRPEATTPLPGERPGKKVGLPFITKEQRMDAAWRTLLQDKKACGECHVDDKGYNLSITTEKIAKPDLPNEWFLHSRFDHGAHARREIDCKQCHPGAYPTDEKDLLRAYALPRKGAEDVLVPGIDNCRECHSPNPTIPNQQARHDCTECHTYHQGGPPSTRRAEACPDRRQRNIESLLRPLVR